MNKFIVTTTIQPPTEATLKYRDKKDWRFIIVGDLKTPHDSYIKLQHESVNVIYLLPEVQETLYPYLSEAIGWNCIQRRNLGFLYAYELGADIIASVDDDNIPYDNWGEKVYAGQEIEVDIWEHKNALPLDPMQLTNYPNLWHRGYPLNYVQHKDEIIYIGKEKKKILFQADFWDGDPDVDAVCRIMYNPTTLKIRTTVPFTSHNWMPFNSQNTFIAREAIPYYMVLPFVGRMDDIWGGYIAQHLLNTRPLFMSATVYQERNKQSILKNLENELLGYTTTSELLNNMESYLDYLPEETVLALSEYRRAYDRLQ